MKAMWFFAGCIALVVGWPLHATAESDIASNCASDLRVTAQYRNGFTAAWHNDAAATGSIIHLCEETPMPATFNEIEHWSFAAVTNTSRISVNYNEQFAKSWPDLLGEVIYVASNTIGAVQVGKTDTRGYIHVTNIVEQVQDIIIRTRVRDEDHQHKMFVVCINDAIATNKVDISAEFVDYVVAVTNAREVVITSSAKNHPLQVADIRLVSDYRPPFIQTNTLSRTNVRLRHSWTFRNIATGDYLWRVESLLGDGSPSALSPYSAISLSPDSPRVPTGFCISIR